MEKKTFYRNNFQEFFNSDEILCYTGNLHYGIPGTSSSIVYESYNDFMRAIEDGQIRSKKFELGRDFFTRKKVIYTVWGCDKVKLKPKYFSSYSQIFRVDREFPSYNEILDKLPINELIAWAQDTGVTLNLSLAPKQ